jgi:hypothetical protein
MPPSSTPNQSKSVIRVSTSEIIRSLSLESLSAGAKLSLRRSGHYRTFIGQKYAPGSREGLLIPGDTLAHGLVLIPGQLFEQIFMAGTVFGR